MTARGFTLLELLVSLAIVFILLFIGVPSFSAQIRATKVSVAADDLLEGANFARARAVFTNKRITMRNLGTWENGWEIFIDTNNNSNRDEGEEVLQAHEQMANITIKANTPVRDYISFVGTGEGELARGNNRGAFQAGTLKVCSVTGSGTSLVLARGGRIRTASISERICHEN